MFFRNTVKTIAVSVALLAFGAQAKTFKYELQDLHSSGADIQYPGLDLNGASSATLTIDQADQDSSPVITSLEINFPSASNLLVKNFKQLPGSAARASVSNAWVYRQVNVEVHGFDIENPNDQMINIDGYVSEADSFIGSGQSDNLGGRLFHAAGKLVDVTPSKIVDVEWLTVNDDRLRLSLRSNPISIPDSNFGEMAFAIDSLWLGKGEEVLYFHAPFGDETKFIEPYMLEVSTITGPDGDEYSIRILAKDMHGNEFPTPDLPLRHLLEDAYDFIPVP
ncbi:hypothetical protein [Microbulbifer sp. GL-2]|uniref:hypothetical protein n=1 Tax=Microbulbifer sp. GL-2 TaxID=2591606 RepID=UPI001163FB1A|nr:hypothetical protein [Microbulbifer sp. GL-2]BBM00407.1 hypothetical protein GL2_04810 [Microbulbifer sp. GL-2]